MTHSMAHITAVKADGSPLSVTHIYEGDPQIGVQRALDVLQTWAKHNDLVVAVVYDRAQHPNHWTTVYDIRGTDVMPMARPGAK